MRGSGKGKKRIGVFVCHCGQNIAASVDVQQVVEAVKELPDVVHAEDYLYMCSEPGQDIIRSAVRRHRLNAIVNANCSPSLHEKTFRTLAAAEGINPYHQEVANIREHCSWPHARDRETATRKAVAIISATIDRLRLNLELVPARIDLNKRVLVIGAGIAGMQAALQIANGGYEVVLVEKLPALGGHAVQLASTFPSLDRPSDFTAPLIRAVTEHPAIRLYTYAEVAGLTGYVGNFTASIKQRASYVDPGTCTRCDACIGVCPVLVPSEFDCGLSMRAAVYRPYPEAVPGRPVIDAGSCRHFTEDSCSACSDVCSVNAIEYTKQDSIVQEDVGAVVVATGYDLFPTERVDEYDTDPDIVTGLHFERLLAANGPTGGIVRRPSDGRIPNNVVFIQCVGSRDQEHGMPYCSRVCCLYTAKQTLLYRQSVPDGQTYVFYMDIRSDVKGTEEFVQDVTERCSTLYLRGRVSRVYRDGEVLKVLGADTLSGARIEIDADMVVLATAMTPRENARELARELNIITDQHGFMTEAHIKLRPVDTLTAGIYLAGTCQWPKDIADTMSSASGAASKILSLFSREELLHDPTIAAVDAELCMGCGQCVSVCAYQAINIDEKRRVAQVNEAICEGCGACAATCPSKAIQHKNSTPRQLCAMVDTFSANYDGLKL